MADLKYRIGDAVEFQGECGHPLVVEDINYAGAVGDDGVLPHTEANAFNYLRCQNPACKRQYQWRIYYEHPRPIDEGP